MLCTLVGCSEQLILHRGSFVVAEKVPQSDSARASLVLFVIMGTCATKSAASSRYAMPDEAELQDIVAPGSEAFSGWTKHASNPVLSLAK